MSKTFFKDNLVYLTLIAALFLIVPFLVSATSGACSWHGGVDCSAGADWDGSVICNDGWRDSSVAYSSMVMCGGGSYYTPTPIPTPSCPLMSSYNSLSGTCQCYSGYVADGSSCVSGLSYCWSKYGYNSSYNSLTKSCECDSGYELKYGTCTKIPKTTNLNYPFYYPTSTPSPTCPANSYENGDKCTCISGYTANPTKTACILAPTPTPLICDYGFLPRNGQCITYTQDCINNFGPNVSGVKGDNNNSSCFCLPSYSWNTDRTACVYQTPAPMPVGTANPFMAQVANFSASDIVKCRTGLAPSLDKKRCIKLPKNSHVASDGKNVWLCDDGYTEKGNSCISANPSVSPSPEIKTEPKIKKSFWSKLKFW